MIRYWESSKVNSDKLNKAAFSTPSRQIYQFRSKNLWSSKKLRTMRYNDNLILSSPFAGKNSSYPIHSLMRNLPQHLASTKIYTAQHSCCRRISQVRSCRRKLATTRKTARCRRNQEFTQNCLSLTPLQHPT